MKNKHVLTGVLFVAISLLFGLNALRYSFGSWDQPGPGLFPMVLSVVLFALGIVNILTGLASVSEYIDFKVKNILIITVSLLGFSVATQYINMIAGIVVLVTISSFAARTYSIPRVIKIIVGLILVALTFKYLLGLNLPL